jgi:polar amino acid transport system permease protein
MAFRKSKQAQVDIPNKIDALPVRRVAPVVAGVVVLVLALMLVQGIVTNERFEWGVVWRYLFNEHVLDGIGWTLILTVASMLIAVVLSVLLAVMRSSGTVVLRGGELVLDLVLPGDPCVYAAGVLGPVLGVGAEAVPGRPVHEH